MHPRVNEIVRLLVDGHTSLIVCERGLAPGDARTRRMRTKSRTARSALLRGVCPVFLTIALTINTIPARVSNPVRLSATSGAVFDDFLGPAGSAPNAQFWDAAPGPTAGIGALENNTVSPSNVRLDGQGHLVIEAQATPTGYTSGRIVTFGKVDMLYGRVEARIKLPSTFAIWPAFWMLGTNFFEVSWPQCGEIDIVDMVSDESHFYAGIHGPVSPPEPSGYVLTTAKRSSDDMPLTDGFHTYWANWRPDFIQLGVDDTPLAEYTPASLPPGAQWVFNEPMFAILNIAVGNAYIGTPDARTTFPATMLVDWFRYTPL